MFARRSLRRSGVGLVGATAIGASAYMVDSAAVHSAQEGAQNKEFTQLEARQQEGAMAAAAPPTTLGLTDEKTEQLRKLGELKKEGILTYEEFVVQKQRLLS